MFIVRCVIACLCLSAARSLPPDKVSAAHIIKTRSIDITNAHTLSHETRLSKAVVPTAYRLELEPYLEDGVFKGHVSINVTWLEDADEITIHCAHQIEITDWEVRARIPADSSVAQKIAVKTLTIEAKRPMAVIGLEKTVPKSSTGHLDFSFNGNLEISSTESFFKTTYTTDSAGERTVIATQLRPNNARRVFPCFDEPGYKTPFELSVVRPRNMVALSNMPVAKTEDITGEPNAVWDHFQKTPPMSTFALGLVIADLKQLGNSTHYEDDHGNCVELRVWGREDYHSALEGLNEKLTLVFEKIANFWQVPLHLPRLDIVALPNYQGVKPVDNWGLIVFRESDLTNGRSIPSLITELSYQWLGALTTPAWWSDSHLNKALVGYLAADMGTKLNHESDWPMTVLYSIYYEYSKRYPHSRITGMKQETACTKIELLFRMFNYTLGGTTFRNGLRQFLQSRQFKTFTGEDIWDALSAAAKADEKLPKETNVKIIANSWIEYDRLPVVTVKREYESNSAIITQKVYLRERPHDVPDANRMAWWIPLVVVRGDHLDFTNTTPVAWMRKEKQQKLNDMPGKEQFLILNPEEIAPYPVNYDTHNWNLISNYLQSKDRTKIPPFTRAKLLHDAWNLAYAGELAFDTALNMTLFLKEERHQFVWEPVFTMIDHLGRHICPCMQLKFQAFVRALLGSLYEELSQEQTEDEEHWHKRLRTMSKSFLCQVGYKPCVHETQEAYSTWMKVKNPDEGMPIPDLNLCPVFMHGSRKEWEFGLERVIHFPSWRKRNERTYLLKTLAGCPTDPYRINRLLNVTLLEGNGNFTDTDLFLILSMLTGSSHGYTVLFDFINVNWDVLKEKYQSKTNLWDDLIQTATSKFTTQEGLDQVTKFYLAHEGEFGSATHIIEKSIRNIREEVKWSSENLPVIDRWMDQYLANAKVNGDHI